MKLLGEMKPRWQLLTRLKSEGLKFPFRRSSGKAGMPESGSSQTRDRVPKDAAAAPTRAAAAAAGESGQSQ